MLDRTYAILALVALPLLGCMDGDPPGTGVPRMEVRAAGSVVARASFDEDPANWEFPVGTWGRREVGGNGVLAQTSTDHVFPVALWKQQRFGDVDVTVRFKPISGRVDASGGIVFRAGDGKNYYVVRANSLEGNFRLYTVKGGDRDQIASTQVDAPLTRRMAHPARGGSRAPHPGLSRWAPAHRPPRRELPGRLRRALDQGGCGHRVR